MDITLYISRFLYRIRYQLIFGSVVVMALVAYFTQFLAKSYTVNTSIYTGIVSSTGLEDENKPTYFEQNSTFDNIINLTKAKGTLETVGIKLFALSMMHGNEEEDNLHITAKHFTALNRLVPSEVKKLIDKQSFDKTLSNLLEYREEIPDNFLFRLLNHDHPHYSYEALKKVNVLRANNSDVIDITYQSDDPGITLNSVRLINEELQSVYNDLRYKATNDIVAYYEEQLKQMQSKLGRLEDELTKYNTENGVINYAEQTKSIAISRSSYEDRYEQMLRDSESSRQLIEQLEVQMETRSKLFRTNTDFINALEEITSINSRITEAEAFSSEKAQASNKELAEYRLKLQEAEKKLAKISGNMNEYKYSKEGVAIESMVSQWLNEVIRNTKAKAELEVMERRASDFEEQYGLYSPVGTQIHRREREIHVTEESYLEVLRGLNMAKIKQKNISLTSANLNTISPPSYPLMSDGRKRLLFIMAAFAGSLLFILGYNLLIELIDRTLRDAERTRRLTKTAVLGAFTGNTQLKHRGYIKACNRLSAIYTCNRLNQYLHQGETACINLLSLEQGEGKSFVARFLIDRWKEQGLRVTFLTIGKDIPSDAALLLTTSYEQISARHHHPDILLIEHLHIQQNDLPSALLKGATANLIISNAQRVWKSSDDELLAHLKKLCDTTPLYIHLNNASREAVEDFTGQLPPHASVFSITSRMMYLGLTAKNASVKN